MSSNKTISVSSTVYPYDYNKNNPMKGFNQWALHIYSENNKDLGQSLVEDANKIIKTKSKINKTR